MPHQKCDVREENVDGSVELPPSVVVRAESLLLEGDALAQKRVLKAESQNEAHVFQQRLID